VRIAPTAAPTKYAPCAVPSQPVGPTGATTPHASARRLSIIAVAATASRRIEQRMRRAYANSGNNHAMRASVVLLAACAGAPATKSADVATPLPSLTLPLMAGGTWSSESARGSALVIDVWASWCKPCSKGFPKLAALAGRRPDVHVIAISIDEDPAAIRGFLAEFPSAVPVAQDGEQVMTRAPLAIERLPTVLIVDAAGMIRHRLEEPSERDYDHLEELIAK
jgi:cytochrome c biogenesis protein CcmG, thiol:disulfide interchange protein DsbE